MLVRLVSLACLACPAPIHVAEDAKARKSNFSGAQVRYLGRIWIPLATALACSGHFPGPELRWPVWSLSRARAALACGGHFPGPELHWPAVVTFLCPCDFVSLETQIPSISLGHRSDPEPVQFLSLSGSRQALSHCALGFPRLVSVPVWDPCVPSIACSTLTGTLASREENGQSSGHVGCCSLSCLGKTKGEDLLFADIVCVCEMLLRSLFRRLTPEDCPLVSA